MNRGNGVLRHVIISSTFISGGLVFFCVTWAAVYGGGVMWDWQAARLLPIEAFARGYDLYAGQDSGVLLGTHYGPVSYFFYSLSVLFESPSSALKAAAVWGTLALSSAVFWLLYRFGESISAPINAVFAGLLVFLALAMYSRASRYMSFSIHADAPALIFATLAFGKIVGRQALKNTDMIAISLFMALSVWSKQLIVALYPAILVYCWSTFGTRTVLRLIGFMFCVGIVVSALFFLLFDPANVWLNLFSIPAGQPRSSILQINHLQYLVDYWEYWLIFTIFGFWHFFQNFRRKTLQWSFSALGNNPVMLPLLAIVTLYPLSVLAVNKVGGDENSHYYIYFLILFCSLTVVEILSTIERDEFTRVFQLTSVVLPIVLSFAVFSQAKVFWTKSYKPRPVDMAYEFEKLNPGLAYFPWHSYAVLKAGGKANHLYYTLIDRELANFDVSAQHMAEGMPPTAKYVVMPVWTARAISLGWPPINAYVPNLSESTSFSADVELPENWASRRWIIFSITPNGK